MVRVLIFHSFARSGLFVLILGFSFAFVSYWSLVGCRHCYDGRGWTSVFPIFHAFKILRFSEFSSICFNFEFFPALVQVETLMQSI